jgi:hypothetical protein
MPASLLHEAQSRWACSCCSHMSLVFYCCAGMVSSSLELHRYATGRASRVVTALTLLKSHLFKCSRALFPSCFPHTSPWPPPPFFPSHCS